MTVMIVTKKYLPRRTVLRGLGVVLGLPLLDAMTPAFARSKGATSPMRLGAVYAPNGMNMPDWTPPVGDALEITPILQPIAPFRDRAVVISGLCNNAAEQIEGEGALGDHSRSSAGFLTGAHAKRTEGADLRNGISMDQVAAKELGRHTQLASLELGLEANEMAGACEHGYSCAYTGTISWASEQTPLPVETDPRAVFERLFGATASTDAKARLERIQKERSILDFVSRQLGQFQRGLSAGDRHRLSEYVDAVRDIERRIQRAEEQSELELPTVVQPGGVPGSYEEYAKLMFDLWALAWQCDLTRVTTFMLGREKSTRSYPEIGVPDAHHPLSHHQKRPEKLAKLTRLNTFHTKLFAHFVEKLQSTSDGDGSLLDHVTILYGSGMSDPDMHYHQDVPMLVVGGGGGRIRGRRHVVVPKGTPMANLYVSLLDRIDVHVAGLGDSTGRLSEL